MVRPPGVNAIHGPRADLGSTTDGRRRVMNFDQLTLDELGAAAPVPASSAPTSIGRPLHCPSCSAITTVTRADGSRQCGSCSVVFVETAATAVRLDRPWQEVLGSPERCPEDPRGRSWAEVLDIAVTRSAVQPTPPRKDRRGSRVVPGGSEAPAPPVGLASRNCPQCGGPMPEAASTGRPGRYCSTRCRKTASRKRQGVSA